MDRIPVKSSSLVSVGYDPDDQTLEIEFKAGVYRYFDVPIRVYLELINAPSLGAYFNFAIRDNYPTERV